MNIEIILRWKDISGKHKKTERFENVTREQAIQYRQWYLDLGYTATMLVEVRPGTQTLFN